MNGFEKPLINIGDKIEIEIVGMDEEKHPDDRIAKVDGFVIFVKDCHADIGEKVQAEITTVLPRYGFAKVVE